MRILLASFLLSISLGASTFQSGDDDIQTVNHVDLEDYMGLWYEVYRLPNSFEKGCYDVTAKYELIGHKVSVRNTCFKQDGTKKVAKGTAFVVNPNTNAQLKVSFVPILQRWGLFAGDYNILALGDDYEYALVGSKDRKFLWILSRTKELSDETVDQLKDRAEFLGFNTEKLIKTPSL
ncbi:MAG: hypothetical protein CME64_07980 [Halobacteriovoraceae bacterium]|nr:hypothetical protein [Halobacteriovoraceae bacterium]|tara:strand:- start:143397 stop:143930 length:534 start_codon:yes stop_codon:yes gene_type:complete